MSARSRMEPKYAKDNDFDVPLITEPISDERRTYKTHYGGFTDEAYDELVRYHRNKEIPKRLQGHLKHRIDCFKRKAKRFQLIEGTDQLIYIGFKPDNSTAGQYVIKKGDVEKILAQAHLETNHGGLNATRKMVSAKFYWNSITSDVEHFIKQCPRCRITRMRYIASNNVPWRKRGRYGDLYSSGSEEDYAAYDGVQNRTWKFTRDNIEDEYVTYEPEVEPDSFLAPPIKRVRSAPDEIIIADDLMSNEDIDVENDVEEEAGVEAKIDTQMFLPHYFRVRPSHYNARMCRQEWEEEPILNCDDSFDNSEQTYFEDDYDETDVGNIMPGVAEAEKLDLEHTYDDNTERTNLANFAVCKEKSIAGSSFKRRYMEDDRECIIETDKKYFMVEAEQLLQLFKRCSICGEKLKQLTLYADSAVPTVAYRCNKCEPAVWFGQKID